LRRQPDLAGALTVLAALLLAAAPAPGQQRTRGLCWRGPTATCQVILLTEVGYHRVLTTNSRMLRYEGTPAPSAPSNGVLSHISWEIGLLRPINERIALGGTFELGASEDGSRHGIHVRGRRFLTSHSSIELSAGVIGASVGDFSTRDARGFNVNARFNLDDKLMLVVSYDDLDWPDPRPDSFIYLDDVARARGLKVGAASGSWPALITSAVGVAAYVALALMLSGSS
jgi:hypothetical protein